MCALCACVCERFLHSEYRFLLLLWFAVGEYVKIQLLVLFSCRPWPGNVYIIPSIAEHWIITSNPNTIDHTIGSGIRIKPTCVCM